MKKFLGAMKWTAIVIVAAFILLVIARIPHAIDKQKTAEQVAKIHATKLTMDDVLGKNLPPDPGADADKTVAGIDANKNGIRDDVELAIFKEYPDSAKTRAVLLQYALALQMQFTQPFLNTDNVIATVQEGDRAHLCLGEIYSRLDLDKFLKDVAVLDSFVKTKMVNTNERKDRENEFFNKIGSYQSLNRKCDIDYTLLAI